MKKCTMIIVLVSLISMSLVNVWVINGENLINSGKSVVPKDLIVIDSSCKYRNVLNNIDNFIYTNRKLVYLYEQFNAIPDYILESMVDDGFKIVLQYDDIEHNLDFDIIGLTVVDERKIYIDIKGNKEQNTLIHEVGHYVDRGIAKNFETTSKKLFSSSSSEFKCCFKKEKDAIEKRYGSYAVKNEKEMFALVFTEIIIGDEDIYYIAPNSCRYVKSIMNKYKSI